MANKLNVVNNISIGINGKPVCIVSITTETGDYIEVGNLAPYPSQFKIIRNFPDAGKDIVIFDGVSIGLKNCLNVSMERNEIGFGRSESILKTQNELILGQIMILLQMFAAAYDAIIPYEEVTTFLREYYLSLCREYISHLN